MTGAGEEVFEWQQPVLGSPAALMPRKGLLAPQNNFLDTIATRFDGTRKLSFLFFKTTCLSFFFFSSPFDFPFFTILFLHFNHSFFPYFFHNFFRNFFSFYVFLFPFFSRVLRDSTPRFVRPSVGRSVGPHFTFFIRFTFLTSPLLPKWPSDLKYGPCPPTRLLPTHTRLR